MRLSSESHRPKNLQKNLKKSRLRILLKNLQPQNNLSKRQLNRQLKSLQKRLQKSLQNRLQKSLPKKLHLRKKLKKSQQKRPLALSPPLSENRKRAVKLIELCHLFDSRKYNRDSFSANVFQVINLLDMAIICSVSI